MGCGRNNREHIIKDAGLAGLSAILITVISTVLLLLFVPFVHRECRASEMKAVNVVVSLPPYADFVKKVGGSRVSVYSLMPVSADPHTFELKPADMRRAEKADIYIATGSGVEFEEKWMNSILGLNRNMKVCDSSRGIPVREGDPHIWLSPVNAISIVKNIESSLIDIDPDNAVLYRKNAEEYISLLKDTDKSIEKLLSVKRGRSFIVVHPAWGYFAQRYGLKEIAIEREGKEPSIRYLRRVVDYAKTSGIKVIFSSQQFGQKEARVVAEEIGADVIRVNPLDENYSTNLLNMAERLSEAL